MNRFELRQVFTSKGELTVKQQFEAANKTRKPVDASQAEDVQSMHLDGDTLLVEGASGHVIKVPFRNIQAFVKSLKS